MSVGHLLFANPRAYRKTCRKCNHAVALHDQRLGVKTEGRANCRMNIVVNPGPSPDTIPCFCKMAVPMAAPKIEVTM